MSRNQFRALIIASLLLAIAGGIVEYFWADPIADKAYEYIAEIEPDVEGARLIFLGIMGAILFILAIISFFGLLFFRAWARHLYVVSFVLFLPLYPLLGVSVYSGVSQVFWELSSMASGAIIALLYFSPVAKYYQKNEFNMQHDTDSVTGAPPPVR